MLQIKFETLVLLSVAFGAASALVCHECTSVAGCRGVDKNKTVTCNQANSEATAVLLRPYFQDLNASLEYNATYQCTNITFIPNGATDLSAIIKGCLYKTKTGLCGVEKTQLSGNMTCISCNSDKCNGSGRLALSMLLLISTWIVRSVVAKV